jgi:hypothetical protein
VEIPTGAPPIAATLDELAGAHGALAGLFG